MKEYEQREEVAIVGGGLAGLTAALYLARGGRSVTLFEKAHAVGGRAITQAEEGFLFNLGPHAIYRAGAAPKILRELGIEYRGGKLPANAFLEYGGQLLQFPGSPLNLLFNKVLKPGALAEMGRVLVKIMRLDPNKYAGVTVDEWFEKEVKRPEVRDIIKALGRVGSYTNAPAILSAGTMLKQLQLALKASVLYLDGGWQTLVDGLKKAGLEAGVQIQTGQRVEAVEGEETVRGVRLADGSFFPASDVIIAAGPVIASKLVQGGDNPALSEWASTAIPVKAACLDLGLSRLPVPERRVVLGVDEPLYLSVQSTWAKLAPEGAFLVHVMKYLDPLKGGEPRKDEQELEAFLDRVQPGWQGEVLFRESYIAGSEEDTTVRRGWGNEVLYHRYLPDLTVINALPEAGKNGNIGRPGPAVPGIANLYVAGDWVGTHGLLAEAALSSAREAAHLVLAGKSRVAQPARRVA